MRKRLLQIGFVLVAALIVLPYLIPLPGQPDRDPATLAQGGGKFVTIKNVQTYVIVTGPVDGIPVVLVHGFGGSTFSWRNNISALSGAGYRVLALDLKGFGLSTKTFEEDYTHSSQAEFVAQVMDQFNMSRAIMVGHSMGGSVISHFALKYPQRTLALVYVDGAVNLNPSGGINWADATYFPPLRRAVQIGMRLVVNESYLINRLKTAYADPAFVTPELSAGYLTQIQMKDWDIGLLGITRDGGRNGLPQPLSTVTTPTLIMWGDKDTWVPIARGEALRAALPQAEWVMVAGSGHLPMEEQAEVFNAKLLEFLKKVKQ